ncbi:MAG: hypothetical protein JNJ61_20520 [Anaerolineae bacterium]|nr:hypothetical protein [Anaerolineae bacterium]
MINIEQLQQRTARYELADGLSDFQTAILWLVQGVIFWTLVDHAPAWRNVLNGLRDSLGDSTGRLVAAVIVTALPLLALAGGLWAMRALRRRWLWRETGMVTPKAWVVPRRVILSGLALTGVVVVLGSLIAIALADGWLMLRALFVGMSWGQAYTLAISAQQLDLPRYRWLALGGVVVPLVLAFVPATVGQFGLVFGLAWTAALVVSGMSAMLATAALQREARDGA